jgi:hypothetical protein
MYANMSTIDTSFFLRVHANFHKIEASYYFLYAKLLGDKVCSTNLQIMDGHGGVGLVNIRRDCISI